jgi:hypothetical protein
LSPSHRLLSGQQRCSQVEPWSQGVSQQNHVLTVLLLTLRTPRGAHAGTGRIGPEACQSFLGEYTRSKPGGVTT